MCTESETLRVLGSEWSITLEELDAFIVILYARGAYETKTLKFHIYGIRSNVLHFFHEQ